MRANSILLFFNSKQKFLLVLLLLLPALTFSQSKDPGSLEYLKLCNGINGIKLGSDIDLIPHNKLAYLDGNGQFDADSCITYSYDNNDLLKVDTDLNLEKIALRTYKNKIVNIYIFFKITDSYKVLRNFLNLYGQFTDLPYAYTDIYDWNSRTVSLSLKYANKVELGVAVFTCNPLVNDINTMKDDRKVLIAKMQLLASVLSLKNKDLQAIR
jgi:hypothetical protein